MPSAHNCKTFFLSIFNLSFPLERKHQVKKNSVKKSLLHVSHNEHQNYGKFIFFTSTCLYTNVMLSINRVFLQLNWLFESFYYNLNEIMLGTEALSNTCQQKNTSLNY